MTPSRLRIAVTLMTIALAAAIVTVAVAETPLPQRRSDRWIYDTASVMEPAHVDALHAVFKELFGKTGVQIVILTVPRLVDETIEELGVRLGQGWGVGRKGEDRGIVVVLAVEDRRARIDVGYGVEGYLPDARAGRLLDTFGIPSFRDDDFSTGLTRVGLALARVSAKEFGVTLTSPGGQARAVSRQGGGRASSDKGGIGGAIIGVLVVIVGLYLAVRHPRLFFLLLMSGMFRGRRGGFGSGGFGGGGGLGGFGGGGFGGGGASRGF